MYNMTRKVLLKEKEEMLTAQKSARAEAEAFRQSIFMRKNEDGDTEYVEPTEEDAGKYDALIAKLKGIAAAIEAIGKQEDADDSSTEESEENSADSDETPVDDDEEGKKEETTEKHASFRGGSKQVMSKNFNINSKFTNFRDFSVGGEQSTRLAFAEYVAKKNGGSYRAAADYMAKNFGDEASAQMITSQRQYAVKGSPVGPTTSTSGTGMLGFERTPIELLREKNEFLSRLERVNMPYGNLVWLRQRIGSTSSYVGENQNLPVTQNAWDLVPSTWKKFGGKTYATIEQIEFSPWEVSAQVTTQLQYSDARFMEEQVLAGTGTIGQVLGIYGNINATNQLTSSVDAITSLFTVQTIANDLERLHLAVSSQGADTTGAFMVTNRNQTAFLRQIRAPLSGLQAFPEISTTKSFNGVEFIETMIVGTDDNSVAKQGNIWFIAPKHVKVADCNRYWVESDDRAVFNDNGNVVSCKDNDLVLFSSRGYFDLMVEHDVVCSVLKTNGWALNSQQAQRYYAQAATGLGLQVAPGSFTTAG
jgi:HK97 family phage major capsid protein